MHRTYNPYTPVTCVFLKQKWDDEVFKNHRKKVHAAKAVIDNRSPREYRHLNIKLKKLQKSMYLIVNHADRKKKAQVLAELTLDWSPIRNSKLRVSVDSPIMVYEATRQEIIDRDNQMLYSKMDHIMRTGGRTDHKNKSLCYSKSLNAAKHKRELVRVAKENRAILNRLSEREPNYNHKKNLMDWQESQQYLKNISRFPPPKRADLTIKIASN